MIESLGSFPVNGVFPVMTEHELLRELDNCAEYCTLSKISVNSGGNDR